MKILIQDAEILDQNSPFHKKIKNVLIADGTIRQIGEKKYTADKVIQAKGMKLSVGWFDLGVYVGDPGLEYKEDLTSVSRAAMAGGFTEIAVLPNTVPSIQSKNDVSYLTRGNKSRLLQVHALASVTKDNKGEELTEMIDLHHAGAVGFTDGLKSLWHSDIYLKALMYLQNFNGVLIDRPEDMWLNMYGQMHEGVNATRLGLKGMPRIAEEIAVRRNLQLLEYAGGRVHFSRISTPESLNLIRAAKKKYKVTCDIASYQPLLDDSSLMDFDTHYKVNPPLRESSDNKALIKGLLDDTIDILSSGHVPQDDESKNLEFDLAEFGIINLQTFGANLVELAKAVKWEQLIDKVTRVPRELLQMEVPVIEVGATANLTLFNPSQKWRLDEKSNFSKSKNSPWFQKEVTGKAVAVFNNDEVWLAV